MIRVSSSQIQGFVTGYFSSCFQSVLLKALRMLLCLSLSSGRRLLGSLGGLGTLLSTPGALLALCQAFAVGSSYTHSQDRFHAQSCGGSYCA